MDKGINWPKIPQMPKTYLSKLSAPAQKFGISMKKSKVLIYIQITYVESFYDLVNMNAPNTASKTPK